MIRFNCKHCGRHYELSAALAGMPLLCKGCGQGFVVPDAGTDVPDAVEPMPLPQPPPVAAVQKRVPPPEAEEDDRPFLIPEPEGQPEPEPEPEAVPSPPRPVRRAVATPEPEPVRAPAGRKILPVVIDVAVGFILLAVGVFLGEVLARKSTRQVWNDAGAAVSFPPVELLQWLGPPVLIMLIYGLLVSKGVSVGGWLKRRGG